MSRRCTLTIAALLVALPTSAAPLLEAPLPLADGCTGSFAVVSGIARAFYYASAHEGANGEAYTEGYFLARKAMNDHPGDWVACGVMVPDGCHWSAGPQTRIILTLPDGSEVASSLIVVHDQASAGKELKVWSTESGWLWFDSTSPYFRHEDRPGEFWLYVRFPEGSLLTGKGATEVLKPFKVRPVAVRIEEGE